MRRFLHGLLVGVLTLWIPIDSAVAGWWHHHRHAMPVAWGPAFPPPCGAAAPFPGWAGAIVIDDRPLGAPPPVAVFVAPPAEVVVDSWITTGPVEWSIVDEGTFIHGESIVEGGPIEEAACVCDPCQDGAGAHADEVFEGSVTGSQEPLGDVIETESVIGVPSPADDASGWDDGVVEPRQPVTSSTPAPRTETNPEPESPTPLELPGTAATTSGDPSTAAQPDPADAPAASVLEPWEPKTVQGDTTAETEADEPASEAIDEAEAFERPEATADVDSADEPMADDPDATPAGQPKRRNLFDDVPADEAEAFEGPRSTEDDVLPPSDAFDAPDDAFEAPQEEMESPDGGDDFAPAADDAPADDMEEGSFESVTDEVMDEAPADEPAVEEPATEEAPVESDPFDTNVLHTPGQPSRSWRDDTGRHGTEGRLVEVRADRVRILKATGRFTTVPMARLSRADRDHVAGVSVALARPAAAPGATAGL